MSVRVKRVYDEPDAGDGHRVLVDRLWPRGVSKEHAELDVWLKDVAPSTELRQWFDHDRQKFDEFAVRYRGELDANPALDELVDLVRTHPSVTLLHAARDQSANHVVVLLELLPREP